MYAGNRIYKGWMCLFRIGIVLFLPKKANLWGILVHEF